MTNANAFPAYYVVSNRGADDRIQMRSTIYMDAVRIFKTVAAQRRREACRIQPSSHDRKCRFPTRRHDAFRRLCVRTFRVLKQGETNVSGMEISCPSLRGVHCNDCGLCGGVSVKAKNITIPAHGAGAASFI